MAAPTLRVTLGQHSCAGGAGPNQDFHGAWLPPPALQARKGLVLALADGIGSSRVSQVASEMAVRSFLEDYGATAESWSVARAGQRVLSATNSWLHAQNQRSDARFDRDRGYVCTFSALILKGRELHLLHVGDARIYRLHAQALEQLTEDHRVQLSSQESYLGRALGAGPQVEIDHRAWPAAVGEVYLLATDGAYAHLDAAAVHAALQQHGGHGDVAAAQLVALAQARARAAGGEAACDDATVQLLRIEALPAASGLPVGREGLALPPPLVPRMAFEGFTVLRPLHQSARSHVHLALDQATGQAVVLKTPSVDLQGDADHLDRLVLEEWVARRVDSPHVLKAWAGERPRSHLFVALEYIEGQTLAQWMVDHPQPDLAAVRGLIEQMARGLQALHRREMLHQDLRPQNVMIDAQGTVKLIDLGAAQVAGLEGLLQGTPPVRGTLQYTAPECLIGQAGSVRAEVFALAVLAYQMLSGQLPYGLQAARVRTPADLRALRYVPLRHHRPDLPAWLDAVLARALSPQAQRRQEAVSELVQDLRTPPTGLQPSRPLPLVERDPVRFWQACCLGLGLLALGLAAALVLRG